MKSTKQADSSTKQSNSFSFLRKAIGFLAQDEIRQQFQLHVIDPLLQHVMKQVFPYIILTCVLFVLLLIVVMLTLGIIVFQLRGGTPEIGKGGGGV
jgi:hypothetical protein